MLNFLMITGFVILQTPEVNEGIISTVLENIIAVGFTGTFAIAMFVLWWKERARASKQRQKWNSILLEEKRATDIKVEVLHRELKDGQKAENDKYVTIIQKQNEINEQTVKALQDNSEVVKSNTKIMGHNMDIMDKHISTYERFIEMLFKHKLND